MNVNWKLQKQKMYFFITSLKLNFCESLQYSDIDRTIFFIGFNRVIPKVEAIA